MATALRRIDPQTQFAIGPPTEHGFFYDVQTSKPLQEEDLQSIEKEMATVAAGQHPFEVAVARKEDVIAYYRDKEQKYKLEILNGIKDETVTLYRDADFIDLCAGPHVPDTGWCRHVRLLGLSGAHWRGETRPSLTRVAGTAWQAEKPLREYLHFLEVARQRDHRILGPQLNLFSFHPWAASALWHPYGVIVRNELLRLWREKISGGYSEILNPLLYRKELFETSGHWEHFREDMFIIPDDTGNPQFVLKPMNCPDTMLYFRAQTRSYRDLPLRIAEGQVLHRNEAVGSLHGIMRTRNFVQDDAHIFLMPDQVQSEVAALLAMLDDIYRTFQLSYDIRLSTRPEAYLGGIDVWNAAEDALRQALAAARCEYIVGEGEGSFYGPKIDVSIRDSLGRRWQCGTIQLDFQLPERFDLRYSAPDGSLQRPIVIHRAIFGSVERFFGVLLEHLNGAWPTWLAPVQVIILPLKDVQLPYCKDLKDKLLASGVRAEIDDVQSLMYRIRQAEQSKIPNILVIGDREVEAGTVTLRRHRVKEQRTIPAEELIRELTDKISQRVFDTEVQNIAAPAITDATPEQEDKSY